MFINLHRRTTISTSQIKRMTLLIAVISVDCRSGVRKVDILRGENTVFVNSTACLFLCEKTLIEDG